MRRRTYLHWIHACVPVASIDLPPLGHPSAQMPGSTSCRCSCDRKECRCRPIALLLFPSWIDRTETAAGRCGHACIWVHAYGRRPAVSCGARSSCCPIATVEVRRAPERDAHASDLSPPRCCARSTCPSCSAAAFSLLETVHGCQQLGAHALAHAHVRVHVGVCCCPSCCACWRRRRERGCFGILDNAFRIDHCLGYHAYEGIIETSILRTHW